MKKTTPLRIALMLTIGNAIAIACANTSSDAGTDSSTHWMNECQADADCGGLKCECGVCTKPCDKPSDCKGLSASASCAAVAGCSSAATVCLRSTQDAGHPSGDAAQPMTGGDCPSGAAASDHCDGRIEQCWLPCSGSLRGQLACLGGTWVAGKGLFPCGSTGAGGATGSGGTTGTAGAGTMGGDCPAGVQGNASCDGRIEQCWTQCTQGFRGQFVCSDGTWLAGHGLFPCGADAGTPKQDAGGPLPGVSTSCMGSADCVATDSVCCPRCDTEPTLATKIGINRTSVSTYQNELCANAGACPPCVPPPGTIDAFCRGGTCEVQDLGKYKACTKDADCKLVPKDCCACGKLPATAFAALSDEPGFEGDRCGTVDCAGCPEPVQVADGSRATCNTTYGYCEIAPPR
jgi:hypothetical protein